MIKFLFIPLIAIYGWILFYENIFLNIVSSEISVNKLTTIKNQNISSITIYDDTHIYLTMAMNNSNTLSIGPFMMQRAETYYMRVISGERFFVDLERYYGKIGDTVDIVYKDLTKVNVINLIIAFLLYQFIMLIFGIGVSIKKEGSMGGLIGKMSGMDKDFELVRDVSTRMDDVAGCAEVKEEIMELVDMIKRGDEYKRMGARLPKGALLTGAPGTGKTLMAKAIAGECGFGFLSVSGSDFNEILVGMGSTRIRKMFEKAKENKPCIIFIDEIDALAQKRSDKLQQKDDKDNTLNALLVEMDGFGSNEGVVVFGATNRSEILDPAIMRAGRFDRKIHFGLPDKNDRREIFSYYFGKVLWEEKDDEICEKIVGVSYGLTGADINNVVNEGVILAVKEGRKGVKGQDMMRALEYVLCGKEKKNYYLTDMERKVVAYHESGHAFIGWIMKGCSIPVRVSMIPTGKSALGYTMRENEEKKLRTKEGMLGEIGMMLGGRIAEEIFIGEITTGASDDFKKAVEQAKSMVMDYNFFMDSYVMNDGYIGKTSRKTVDEVASRIVRGLYGICKEEMEKRRGKVEEMVKVLMERGKMEVNEIGEIFGEDMRDIVKIGEDFFSEF